MLLWVPNRLVSLVDSVRNWPSLADYGLSCPHLSTPLATFWALLKVKIKSSSKGYLRRDANRNEELSHIAVAAMGSNLV